MKYNIFIEGIQGSGKTTLLNSIAECLKGYTFYQEGDISPIELAWCSYMSEEEYQKTLLLIPDFTQEIENNTIKENNHFITSYTKIHTDKLEFYNLMEQYEIYSGRKNIKDFKDIIVTRFRTLKSKGNLFECAFFQNIMDELILYQLLSSEEIIEFYNEIISILDLTSFRLIRIVSDDIESNLIKIKEERVNDKGEEVWFSVMIDYLKNSPYGKEKCLQNFDDLVTYFKLRIEIEEKVLKILPSENYLCVKSKDYKLDTIVNNFLHVTK